jgi:hypothetical protein
MLARALLPILVAALALAARDGLGNRPTPIVAPPPASRLGVHMLLSEGRVPWPLADWSDHVELAAEAVGEGGYVLQVLSDGNRDLAKWQAFMAAARRERLRPIVRLATRYDKKLRLWRTPLPDRDRRGYRRAAATYSEFLQKLRWPPGERVVVVGNEPNRGDEWGGRPDPVAYARFLRDVAAELRPLGYTVLNAPLDQYCPNTGAGRVDGVRYVDAESFLDGMHAAEPDFALTLDGWASHAYPQGPFAAPPGEQTFKVDYLNGATNPHHVEAEPGIYNRGVNGYGFDLQKLRSYGAPPLPVWITETGWRHAESNGPSPDREGATIGQFDAAERMLLALVGPGDGTTPVGYVPWLHDPRVRAVVFFGFDGDPRQWGHTSWLRLDARGHVLGAYAPFYALRELRLRLATTAP